jgi:hypothetical protein
MPPRAHVVFAVLFCLGFLTPPLCAQSSTLGALAGVVTDPTGARVPGALIHLAQPATRASINLTADGYGNFTAPALFPGRWRVSISATNFSVSALWVDIEVGRVTYLSSGQINLPAIVTTVFSTTGAPLDASGPAIVTNISQSEIADLPINGRRWQSFALLAPTANADGNGELISFRGITGLQNNSTLDGADSNQSFLAPDGAYSRVPYTIAQSAIREFQVNVSTYSAQYGRAAGAVIDSVTSSGGDSTHGDTFFYDRNSDWAAVNQGTALFLPQPDGTLVPSQPPTDDRRQWGAAIGGPIRFAHSTEPARVFYHYTYDQESRDFPALSTVTNGPQFALSQAAPPDPTGFNPSTSTCADETTGPNKSTGSELNPALYGTQGACYLNLYNSTLYPDYAAAAAAYNNSLAYIYSLLGAAPRTSSIINNLPRMDWRINPRSYLAVEYNRMRYSAPGGGETAPFINYGISSPGNDALKLDQLIARHSFFITANLVNEFRAAYQHDVDTEYAPPPLPQEPHTALNGTAAPGVNISQVLAIGTKPQLNRNAFPDENRIQFADTFAWVRKAHTFHMGGDFQHVTDRISALYAAAGSYSYTNMQDFLIDDATQSAIPSAHCGITNSSQYLCYSSYQQGFGVPGLSFATNDFAVFAQDDWKLSPRLVLNLGLRYDLEQLPPAQLPNILLPATATLPSDKNNFGPRLGFAWDPTGHSRTVLRGGAGLYYGRLLASTIYNALTNTATSGGQALYSITSGNTAPHYPFTLAASPTLTTTSGPNVTVFAQKYQLPSIIQASLELEQDIGHATALTFAGLLSLGRDFPIVVDANLTPPGSIADLPATITYNFVNGGPLNNTSATVPFYAGPRPNLNFGAINTYESRANSEYSAFVLGFRHRMGSVLSLRATYTFSHATDDGQETYLSSASNQVLDPSNFALQRGASTYDRRQHLVAAIVWRPRSEFSSANLQRLARDWQLSTIVQAASGRPYSALLIGRAPAQENAIASQTISATSYGYLGAGGPDFLPQIGRNHYGQPATSLVDLRLLRRFALSERFHLQAMAEAFNLLNHRNISGYGSSAGLNEAAYQIGSGQSGLNPVTASYLPTFQQVDSANASTLFTSRQFQFGAKLEF